MRITAIATALAILISAAPANATNHDGKTSMDKETLRECIINGIQATGAEATATRIDLLMETAAVESRLGKYDVPYKAKGSCGVFQIHRSTATDTLLWFGRVSDHRCAMMLTMLIDANAADKENLIDNVEFGAAIAWLVYFRMAPKADISTREKRAKLWKRVYNTPLGRGTVEGYLKVAEELL